MITVGSDANLRLRFVKFASILRIEQTNEDPNRCTRFLGRYRGVSGARVEPAVYDGINPEDTAQVK